VEKYNKEKELLKKKNKMQASSQIGLHEELKPMIESNDEPENKKA
jgi:hypothetical protein